MQAPDLTGVVALITGATRGVGKGIADALVEWGARVYVAGRSVAAQEDAGTESASAAGTRVSIRCDHTSDADTERAFDRLLARERRIDLLVNAAWGGYERMSEAGQFTWPLPFWQQPMWRWDAMFDSGVRPVFACARHAARIMSEQRSGLIVNLSFWAAQKYLGNAIYGAAKCATDRFTRDMALELADLNVTVVAMYPGMVRTELVMEAAAFLDLSNSESPQFTGRAIAHLYADPQRHRRAGGVIVAAAFAREVGFADVDGRQPISLTLETT